MAMQVNVDKKNFHLIKREYNQMNKMTWLDVNEVPDFSHLTTQKFDIFSP